MGSCARRSGSNALEATPRTAHRRPVGTCENTELMEHYSLRPRWVLIVCAAVLSGCVSYDKPVPARQPGIADLAALARAAPFVVDAERPHPVPLSADIIALLESKKAKGDTDHLGLLAEYGLRVHWQYLKHSKLARELPTEANMMLSEFVRIGGIPKYTTAHEAGWLNSQFHGRFEQTGWSSYQIYVWVKERMPAILCDEKRFPNLERIGALMETIENSPLNGVGGGGVCHYWCLQAKRQDDEAVARRVGVAGFCLIANGAYIACGPADGAADTGVMMQHGSARWAMVAFGIVTATVGVYLWHGQGESFGLGAAKGKVSRQAVIVSAALLVAIVGLELIINSK